MPIAALDWVGNCIFFICSFSIIYILFHVLFQVWHDVFFNLALRDIIGIMVGSGSFMGIGAGYIIAPNKPFVVLFVLPGTVFLYLLLKYNPKYPLRLTDILYVACLGVLVVTSWCTALN
jgi:hypothetical protein